MTKPTPTHHSDTELSQNVSLLYDDIIILVGKIIEAKVSNINESFKRVPGLSLREYLILLDSYGIFENLDHDLLMKSYVNGLDQHDDLESDHISNSDDQTFNEGSNGRCRSNRSMNSLDNCSAVMTDSSSQASGFIISGHSEYVASFAELYEELRFSGKPIMEDQFEIFMGMLINLLKNIDFPHFDRQNSTDDSQINRDDAVNAFVGDFNHLYAPSEGGYATGDDISRVTTRLSAIASDRSMQHSKKHTSFYDKQGKKSFNFTKHLHPLNPTDSNLLRKTKTWLSGVSSHKAESKYHYSEAEMSDRRSERSISSGDEYGYSSPASSVIRYTIDDTQSPDQIIGNPRHRLSFPISIHRSQHNMDNTADDRLSRNSSEYEGSVIIRSAE
ncbi:hypothetical protein NADFUDRAFT_78443 [Nadsonia fulvescens var. elongata DSM 6958]|uniref:Uncharacterized protein n=1 Tax=Nadsonia fulvescens var. elongata DSM 6958 TaxID=857566 RepID=A0A1E3PJZ0_9ASCO|nr:hypothetical protein NADFUDRAFT_78443 [Nadsonia fulvescens var. elongata DSM 6958]